MRTRGFTLVEMMVYILLSGIVMTSVYQLLVGQSRSYGKQRELMDVHGSLRAVSALLAWEIRQLSAGDGDIYAIGANSITLRSTQATGIVCATAHTPTKARFGIRGESGDLAATVDDSALIFAAAGATIGDDTWKVLKITELDTLGVMYIGTCVWTASGPPDFGVEIAVTAPSDTADVKVGAPFRAFRRVEYGIYLDGGRWWLGRKVGGAATYEKMTGPLRSQAAGGLVFTYTDATGAPTADPTQVATVDFIIRAESYVRPQGMVDYQVDSLSTRVTVRG